MKQLVDTDESLMIRACALESMDNQCGKFKFEGSLYAVSVRLYFTRRKINQLLNRDAF